MSLRRASLLRMVPSRGLSSPWMRAGTKGKGKGLRACRGRDGWHVVPGVFAIDYELVSLQ